MIMRFSAKFRPRMFEAGAASWTEGLLHPSTRRVTNRLSRYIRTTALRKLNTTCILVSGRVLTLRYYASQLKFMIFLLSRSLLPGPASAHWDDLLVYAGVPAGVGPTPASLPLLPPAAVPDLFHGPGGSGRQAATTSRGATWTPLTLIFSLPLRIAF